MLIRSLCLTSATALSLLAATAAAQRPGPPPPTPEQAARRVERAVLRLELFDRVEHPTAVRRLEDAIAVTRARVALHQRQVAEYSRFDKVLYSKPLFLSLELAKLNLVAARTDLDLLQREKLLIMQHRSQHRGCDNLKSIRPSNNSGDWSGASVPNPHPKRPPGNRRRPKRDASSAVASRSSRRVCASRDRSPNLVGEDDYGWLATELAT